MRLLLSPLAGFHYALAQLVLPGGRPGRWLAGFFLRQALFFNPRHDRAVGYLNYLDGVRSMERGEPDEALALLRRAMRALPEDPAVALDAGVAMTIAGEHEAAVTTLSRLLGAHQRRMAQEPQLWFALAWSQTRLGQYQRALQTAQEAVAARAVAPGLRLTAALARVGAGEPAEPPVVRALLRHHPRLLSNVLEFTEQMAEAGQTAAAEALLEALPADLRPTGARLVALSSLHRESLPAARWAADRFSALVGRHPQALVLESQLRAQEGNLPAAVKAAQEALAAAPAAAAQPPAPGMTAAAEAQLGEALLLSGREEEAYRHFVEALSHGSPSALAGGVVALHLLAEGRGEDARKVFRMERLGADLGLAYAHAATALVLLDGGRVAEALALAEQSLEAFRALPPWAAPPPVVRALTAALTGAGQACLRQAQATGPDELAQRAQRLLRRLLGPT
jgi:tetratricopeptide (TPR) repeat protein